MKLTFKVRGARALITNLKRYERRVEREVRAAVAEAGARVYQRAVDLAPKRTHFMAEHLRLELSKDGLVHSVGFAEEDFTNAGKPFYPPYVEYGTSVAPAQPFLTPASREGRDFLRRRLHAALNRAARRTGG